MTTKAIMHNIEAIKPEKNKQIIIFAMGTVRIILISAVENLSALRLKLFVVKALKSAKNIAIYTTFNK